MGSQSRRVRAARQVRAPELHGQPGQRRRRPVRRGQLRHVPPFRKVGMVEQVHGGVDRRVGDVGRLEPGHQAAEVAGARQLLGAPGQPGELPASARVAPQRRFGPEVVQPELPAIGLPLGVAGDADEHVAPVPGLEHPVDAPPEVLSHAALGHGGRDLPGYARLGDVLGHQEHRGLEQPHPDGVASAGVTGLDAVPPLPFPHGAAPAAAVAPEQRGEYADDAEQGAGHVHDRGARAQGRARRASHVGESAHHLGRLVQQVAPFVGSGKEPLDAAVEQSRPDPLHGLEAETHALQHFGAVVVDDHVGRAQEARERVPATRRLEVQGDAALVAVEGQEIPLVAAAEPGLVAAARALHLDDVRAQRGEDEAGGGTGDDVAELQDSDSVEHFAPGEVRTGS